jgi:hypothetical protein
MLARYFPVLLLRRLIWNDGLIQETHRDFNG